MKGTCGLTRNLDFASANKVGGQDITAHQTKNHLQRIKQQHKILDLEATTTDFQPKYTRSTKQRIRENFTKQQLDPNELRTEVEETGEQTPPKSLTLNGNIRQDKRGT